jgi:hypothetical protein
MGNIISGFKHSSASSGASHIGAGGGTSKLKFTYRGDSRPPNVIFSEGFRPKGTNTDLKQYVLTNKPSIFVSTSKSEQVAKNFAGPGGWVYTVNPGREGIDVNQKLGPHVYQNEQEIAVKGGVKVKDIARARQLDDAGRDYTGPAIENPLFRP